MGGCDGRPQGSFSRLVEDSPRVGSFAFVGFGEPRRVASSDEDLLFMPGVQSGAKDLPALRGERDGLWLLHSLQQLGEQRKVLGTRSVRGKLWMVKWNRTVATVGRGENVTFVRLLLKEPAEESTWQVEKSGEKKEYDELREAIAAAHKLNECKKMDRGRDEAPDGEGRPSNAGGS